MGLPRRWIAMHIVGKYFVHILIFVIHTWTIDGERVSCNTALSHSISKQLFFKVHLFLKSAWASSLSLTSSQKSASKWARFELWRKGFHGETVRIRVFNQGPMGDLITCLDTQTIVISYAIAIFSEKAFRIKSGSFAKWGITFIPRGTILHDLQRQSNPNIFSQEARERDSGVVLMMLIAMTIMGVLMLLAVLVLFLIDVVAVDGVVVRALCACGCWLGWGWGLGYWLVGMGVSVGGMCVQCIFMVNWYYSGLKWGSGLLLKRNYLVG